MVFSKNSSGSVPCDSIKFAKNFEIAPHFLLFFHFKHTRRVKSIPVSLRNCARILLLILGGDVELNPGPVAHLISVHGDSVNPFSLRCCADFHQGSVAFPVEARGRQCVPTCLMFLVTANYVKQCSSFEKEDLNDVLFAGSFLYCAMRENQSSISGSIDPDILPGCITFKGHTIYHTHKGTITGLIDKSFPREYENIYKKLEVAFSQALRRFRNMIVVFKDMSLAIHVHESKFYVFDSHSRNNEGMISPDGKCVLGVIDSVPDLCCYLRLLADCPNSEQKYIQFDLHMICFWKSNYNHISYCINILDKRQGCTIVQAKKRRNSEIACTPLNEKSKKLRKTELMKGVSFLDAIDDRHLPVNSNETIAHASTKSRKEFCKNTDRLFSLHCCADFHQGSVALPVEARGRQCVPTCLMFLVTANYVKQCSSFEKEDLNDVLFAGSFLYCAMSENQDSIPGLVDPTFLPRRIAYNGHTVYHTHKGIITGLMNKYSPTVCKGESESMERAFNKAFKLVKNLIVVFKEMSLAIHVHESKFYVFDSHSRNDEGMMCPDGKCVLGVIDSVPDLSCYLCQLADCPNNEQKNIQFDLHMICFRKKPIKTTDFVNILDKRQGYLIEKVKRHNSNIKKPHFNLPSESHTVTELTSRQDLVHVIDDLSVSAPVNEMCSQNKCDLVKTFDELVGHTVSELTSGKYLVHVIDDLSVSAPVNETCSHKECDLVKTFDELVSQGPNYICTCCTQTFFRHFMKNVDKMSVFNKKFIVKFCTKFKSFDEIEWICRTCWDSARKGKIPKMWIHNGLKFPIKPNELDLSNLEERLVSPRIPFMQLRQMPRGGQVSVKGNIVNVPADVSGTMKSLPRMVDDNETIMLKLKRKLSYKHHVAFENIRPNKVFQAAKWLVSNSILFRNEGIFVNEDWLQQQHNSNPLENEDPILNDSNEQHSDDDWTEEDGFTDRPTGNLDTVLQSEDFREFNQILSVAPGEKNTPLGLYHDFNSEIFSFPTIFCGQTRVDNKDRLVPLHYSDICKWELRNVDRRVTLCVPNIFFKLKRLQIKQIRDKVLLAVRKCKANNQSFTASQILSPGFVEKLTMQDDGYRVLRTLRGSPPYWEAAQRDVFAMIRQLGIPTWFCSFSAAETKWVPLLKSLSQLLSGKPLSTEEISELSWEQKCSLIKSDPVTCARYFHNRVQVFIRNVIKHSSQPIGGVQDYFYRVEFQQRGSPHIHMIAWVKDAPIHGVSSDEEISAFVDKYITCLKDETIPVLINYQTHRHAQTCKKQGKSICRFSFPIPPMPETLVLHPFDEHQNKSQFNLNYEHIVKCLNDLHSEDSDMSFDNFLFKLEMDYESYILSIKSTLSRPKVFLKRSLQETRINNYNSLLLKCWKANMDIQYILDPYSCVSYIVSYISKGQRGLSNLLQAACMEANELDSDIRQRVRRIGNQFLSSVEIGAQEAVFLALQMPLRKCTRDVIYVDTNRPEKRTSLIKPLSELKDLPATSKNIEMDNVLKRYVRRPRILENICYADFASWYELCKGRKKQNDTCTSTEEELPEDDYNVDLDDTGDADEIDNFDENIIFFPCGTQVRKRKQQKVIYTHVTPIINDREEHFREKIMLYTHWRHEDTDLIEKFDSFEGCYNAKSDEIAKNKKNYERIDDNMYENIHTDIDSSNLLSTLDPEANHQDLIDAEVGTSRYSELGCFDPGNEIREDYDVGEDIGVSRKRVVSEALPLNELSEEQFLEAVQVLNSEQKKFFYHILFRVKSKSLPFFTFLSGGAGCGKSVVIRALSQALLKYFSHKRGEDPTSLKMLLCAPTGKAAHNIGGNTLHSSFCIPANQGYQFKPLDMQQLNTMRAHYHDLKIVIIDEISMVGRGMLNFVNLRLQKIKGCTQPFGDVSILAVGDLYQLKPISDSWIFSEVYKRANIQSLGINLWIDLFDFFELTKIMRQKDDLMFAELLNRVRKCTHTNEDLQILESRKICNLEACPEDIMNFPHLFAAKSDMYDHNKAILENCSATDKINIEAIDTVSGNVCQSLVIAILSNIPLDPSKTMSLHKNLVLAIGLPVELCLNIDTSDGLTNGAPGIVKMFDFRVENSSRCSIIWVLFDSENVGKKWRLKYKNLYKPGIMADWTPVLETCRKFTYQYYKTYLIVRRQFPLYLSAGKTIHKSQGSTIQKAVIHFGKRKVDHLHYVGLSRVTNLNGVYIKELNEKKISVSPNVEAEINRLQICKPVEVLFPDFSQFHSSLKTICFQNCRSLKKHIKDITHEFNLLQSDIIGFAETRLYSPLSDAYFLCGFKHLSSSLEHSPHGMTVYYKERINVCRSTCLTNSGIECILMCLKDFIIGFVYCPPNSATESNFSTFLTHIMSVISGDFCMSHVSKRLVLMGDFNYDYTISNPIARKIDEVLGSTQLIHSLTTDYDSCLDHIYSCLPEDNIRKYGTLESYYSDHKPIYFVYSC